MYFQKNGTKLQNYFDICKFCRTFAQNFHEMKGFYLFLFTKSTLISIFLRKNLHMSFFCCTFARFFGSEAEKG